MFLRMVNTEIIALSDEPTMPNLSQLHKEALLQLKSFKDLVIKEADKGGCVVVLAKDHYKQICLDILNNRSW